MSPAHVRRLTDRQHVLGNAAFEMTVELTPKHAPVLRLLKSAKQPKVNWAAPARPLGPELTIQGTDYSLASGNVRFERFESADDGLSLVYLLSNGLEVTQHLKPSPDKAVWRSWVTLHNPTATTITAITRFDAANYVFSCGESQPQCGYVLGWLEGPRADAPGHLAIPFAYCGWIPGLLYPPNTPLPPRPENWVAPVYRFCRERLTRLPLRSGKRSTYDDHPWVTVLDPQRQGGWFLGFEWSGTWKIDVEHLLPTREVTVHACTDANSHDLRTGETLVSPAAFIGVFAGDWDDASNLCRWYLDDEVIPKIDKPWPTTLLGYGGYMDQGKRGDAYVQRELSMAAQLGFETAHVDAWWWDGSADPGDFSVGLGTFSESRIKFPGGLRAFSDQVHSLGMYMSLWFELERVDLRTANRLRHPWKPEWIVQQKGYPYRSWGPHYFMLCLGIKAAQDWALENILWAIEQYKLDHIMYDGNQWAICDDPTHDHGAGDGEWAQIQGFYRVMEGVRAAYPNLMIMNCAGGSQRGDFGMARYCNCVYPHDQMPPSSRQRRYMHGAGCMYPTSYLANVLTDYTAQPKSDCWVEGGGSHARPSDEQIGAARFEWRVLSRLLGHFAVGLELVSLPDCQQAILAKAMALYKRIRHCTHGDRYVLAGPTIQYVTTLGEDDAWECYQHVARDGSMSAVHIFRCESTQDTRTWVLRGLDPCAIYHADFWSGRSERDYTGAELVERGYTCTLPRMRCAEIMVLTRQDSR